MFTKRRVELAAAIMVGTFAAACGQDSTNLSPGGPSANGSQAPAVNLTAAETAALSASCGGPGNGLITGVPPTATPPPSTVIGGPGVLGPGDTVTTPGAPTAPAPGSPLAIGGAVDGLSGVCPAMTFTIGGKTVRTTAATSFGDGACASLRNGDRVGAIGTAQADGLIAASCVGGL